MEVSRGGGGGGGGGEEEIGAHTHAGTHSTDPRSRSPFFLSPPPPLPSSSSAAHGGAAPQSGVPAGGRKP